MTDEVAFDLTALENMIPQGVAFLTFRTPDGPTVPTPGWSTIRTQARRPEPVGA